MIILDYEKIERLAKLTEGNSTLCYQCGTCSATCPYAFLGEKDISVRRLIRYAQFGQPVDDTSLWLCSMCAHCDFSCPRGVEITKVLRGLRVLAQEQKWVPNKVNETLWMLYENGNPWGYTKVDMKKALIKMKVKQKVKANPAEVAIHACCMAYIDPRIQKMTKNVLSILDKAEVSYNYYTGEKACCGDFIYQVGEDAFLEEFINQKIAELENINAGVLLVISPHTQYMFKHVYPKFGVNLPAEVVHYTEYLAELIDNGKIKVNKLNEQVTYHDPCYLGRKGDGIFEEPRKIIELVSNDNFVEMEHNKNNALCCGAGGGLMFLDIDERPPSTLRIDEANETGAKLLATACPYCIRMFDDAAKISKKAPEILDVSELLTKALL